MNKNLQHGRSMPSSFQSPTMGSLQPPSASVLAMPAFEDLSDDVASPLRIPTFKPVFPPTSTERPFPLGPLTSMDVEASKLTGRQMALAHAKTIEAPRASELEALVSLSSVDHGNPPPVNPLQEHNKRKRKLALHEQVVQLPMPKPKLDDVNKPPFQPIAALNQLNEPPPSAALFPPITPGQKDRERSGLTEGASKATRISLNEGVRRKRGRPRKNDPPAPPKRNYTRPRRRWTEAETESLKQGIAICGTGRWKDILSHPHLQFQEGRTHVDLKDRFRTMYPPDQPEKWMENSADTGNASDNILSPPPPSPQRQRAPYRGWSEREDIELDKGFKIYGYQWQLIAEDESLHFNNRSANQVRDRFRRRFPEIYKEKPPLSVVQPGRKKKKGPDTFKENGTAKMRKNDSSPQMTEDQARTIITSNNPIAMSHPPYVERGRGAPRGAASDPLTHMLNVPVQGAEFADPLAALGDVSLQPVLHWDEMAVQPMFDLA